MKHELDNIKQWWADFKFKSSRGKYDGIYIKLLLMFSVSSVLSLIYLLVNKG